jgi:hypothetical protein
MVKPSPTGAGRLTIKSVEAWEARNEKALRAALSKAERDARAGKGIIFDPMKPSALLKRIVAYTKRRRAA